MSDLRIEFIQGQLNDIEENVRSIKATWGNTIMTLDNIKSSLKADRQKSIEEVYQKGLDDAWKAANWLFNNNSVVADVFGLSDDQSIECVFLEYSPSDAIAKIKAYEEQQEQNRRIMFGDKLLTKKDHLGGVALSNEVNGSVYVWREDCVAYESSPQEWRKTGENIPQVAELLKAMKEGAE